MDKATKQAAAFATDARQTGARLSGCIQQFVYDKRRYKNHVLAELLHHTTPVAKPEGSTSSVTSTCAHLAVSTMQTY